MFEFIRKLTKSDEEKRQEFLTAYLDDSLSSKDKRLFEQMLEDDSALRSDLEQQRQIKEAVQQLPRLRAPRYFTLDPSLYGRPSSQRSFQLYPALRIATALAMVVFIALVSIDIFVSDVDQYSGLSTSDEVAQVTEKLAAEPALAEGALVESEELAARSTALDEPVAAAPVEAEAVEEAVEEEAILEEEVILEEEAVLEDEAVPEDVGALESEFVAPAPQATGTQIAIEAAPVAEEAAEQPQAEVDSGESAGAESGTASAVLSFAQTVVASRAGDDQVGDGVGESTEGDAVDSVATPSAVVEAPIFQEELETALTSEELIEAAELTPDFLLAVPEDAPEKSEKDASRELRTDSEPILGLEPYRLAEICLGLSVVVLILVTLLLRREVRKGS